MVVTHADVKIKLKVSLLKSWSRKRCTERDTTNCNILPANAVSKNAELPNNENNKL